MPLNPVEFRRRSEEFFATSYMTSLGVIQSVALGLLAGKLNTEPLTLLQALGSFFAIVLVFEEYQWFLLLVRQTPNMIDAMLPYILGGTELIAITFVGNKAGWWFPAMGMLGIAGLLSLYNSYLYCTPVNFSESMWLLPRVHWNLGVGMALVSGMIYLMFAAWFLGTRLSAWTQIEAILGLYGLMGAMLFISSRFLQSTADEFKRLAEVVPDLNLHGGLSA